MITPKRHQLILELVRKSNSVTIQELVDLTDTSDSTIRRDLNELERQGKIKRVHGGATLKQLTSLELSYPEKTTKQSMEKKRIAQYAASLVNEKECIFLDAGTTTFEMIPFLANKQITVVTNGLTHLDTLGQFKITTYLLGGYVKHNTRALIGNGAQVSINNYRFDKSFLGVNGVDLNYGFTTPDPEEARIKQLAMQLTQSCFVLADISKLNEVSFAKIGELNQATIITNKGESHDWTPYKEKTKIKVVES